MNSLQEPSFAFLRVFLCRLLKVVLWSERVKTHAILERLGLMQEAGMKYKVV